jgi:hypothetical protein
MQVIPDNMASMQVIPYAITHSFKDGCFGNYGVPNHCTNVIELVCEHAGDPYNVCEHAVIDICKLCGQPAAQASTLLCTRTYRQIAMRSWSRQMKRGPTPVDCRSIMDLRSGATFTRFQTLLLQDPLTSLLVAWCRWTSIGLHAVCILIGYGSCQYPTLGLIVKRQMCVLWHR